MDHLSFLWVSLIVKRGPEKDWIVILGLKSPEMVLGILKESEGSLKPRGLGWIEAFLEELESIV